MKVIIHDVNKTVRGWYEYFKHAYRHIFGNLDGMIRRRLRAILRKRQKISGHTNRFDNRRWPNAYFEARGLFFMAEAHRREIQSLRKG